MTTHNADGQYWIDAKIPYGGGFMVMRGENKKVCVLEIYRSTKEEAQEIVDALNRGTGRKEDG